MSYLELWRVSKEPTQSCSRRLCVSTLLSGSRWPPGKLSEHIITENSTTHNTLHVTGVGQSEPQGTPGLLRMSTMCTTITA